MINLSDLEPQLQTDLSLKYWNKDLLTRSFSAQSYKELGGLAFELINRMPRPIGQVCGPISTGGLGSIEKNLIVLNRTIGKLMGQGRIVFNQMPFEGPMQKIRQLNRAKVKDSLLDDFYLPLFTSGVISDLYFVHGWESSFGATWEHGKAKELGIAISYLERDFHVD